MKLKGITVIAAAALLLPPLLPRAEAGKSIYGEDNRQDFFEMPTDMRALSGSVVSLWRAGSVTAEGGNVKLGTVKFGDRDFGGGVKLCPEEKFRDQPVGAFCSGSLVGEDLVMTAGHCIKSEDQCKGTKFVFGYQVRKAGEAATTLPASEVYGCSQVVKRFLFSEQPADPASGGVMGSDYALVKLDRKVTGHSPLAINRTASLKKGDGIFVIGHPVGLPVKLAGSATVRDTAKPSFFVADLDTFGGNSGSPVFNARTKQIEGILVRGDEDFKMSPAGCLTMATYEQTGGRGEDVTKVSELSSVIPKLRGEKDAAENPEVREVDTSAMQPVDATPSKSISFD